MKADVTEGSDKLAEAIGDDSEAVVCATGFRPGWDLFAPWKVTGFCSSLVDLCACFYIYCIVLIAHIMLLKVFLVTESFGFSKVSKLMITDTTCMS